MPDLLLAENFDVNGLIERFVDQLDGSWARAVSTIPKAGSVGRFTAGGLAPGQALKTFVARISLTAAPQTFALWTVTIGKTLYVTDILMTTDENTTPMDIRIQANALDIWRSFLRDLIPVQQPGIETQPQGSSGQAITLVVPANATKNMIVTVMSVEQ